MTARVGLSGAGLAKFRSAVTVVSARAGALQLTTAPAAFLHNSKLVRQCLSRVMCGRRPHCKENLTFGLRSGASHVSGLFARHHDRWP